MDFLVKEWDPAGLYYASSKEYGWPPLSDGPVMNVTSYEDLKIPRLNYIVFEPLGKFHYYY